MTHTNQIRRLPKPTENYFIPFKNLYSVLKISNVISHCAAVAFKVYCEVYIVAGWHWRAAIAWWWWGV